MYFIDRDHIEKKLQLLETLLTEFEEKKQWSNTIEKLGLERIVQLKIEIILDVGNDMIDGFIMRDPGSYDDIIDILEDENVIPIESSAALKDMIRFRKKLVQEYITVNHDHLLDGLQRNLSHVKKFAPMVRTYLENELGPVSAFK